MKSAWTRRAALGGGLAALGTSLSAAAIETSLRPVARPIAGLGVRPVARPDAMEIIRRSEISGQVGFVLRDLNSGDATLDILGDELMPPASVTKAITATYALESLGPAYRFETKILVTGPIIDGALEGDLILAGGGNPTLSTDDLITLRTQLTERGLKEVRGRFLVWGGAIDKVTEIEPGQLDHLGYNPSISGLNLNFNRVHFEWERKGEGFRVQMDARGQTEQPLVDMARMEIVDRRSPVFAYADGKGVDRWTVARSALNDSGSRWLPVRYPALYSGDVFQALCATADIKLPAPELANARPAGESIAVHQSPPLAEMMRRMLRFSTNLTAEAAGLLATHARSGQSRGLRTSAFQMTNWARGQGAAGASFDDHSGLSDASRISAAGMTQFLVHRGKYDELSPILKPVPFLDSKGNLATDIDAKVRAKTGTLNFVSTLAGYIETGRGGRYAFAFFAADMERRLAAKASGEERPRGTQSYNTKAKLLQQALLRHVAMLF